MNLHNAFWPAALDWLDHHKDDRTSALQQLQKVNLRCRARLWSRSTFHILSTLYTSFATVLNSDYREIYPLWSKLKITKSTGPWYQRTNPQTRPRSDPQIEPPDQARIWPLRSHRDLTPQITHRSDPQIRPGLDPSHHIAISPLRSHTDLTPRSDPDWAPQITPRSDSQMEPSDRTHRSDPDWTPQITSRSHP